MRINGLELRIQKIITWTLCHELVDSNCVLMDFNSRNNQLISQARYSAVSAFVVQQLIFRIELIIFHQIKYELRRF